MADHTQSDESPPRAEKGRLLADRPPPRSPAEMVGPEWPTGAAGALTRIVASHTLGTMVFWGQQATGKTTVARLPAGQTDFAFVTTDTSNRRANG